MKLTCPGCGAHGSIEMFAADVDARQCVGRAAALPAALGPAVLEYLTLFRPAKRLLPWPRAHKLLEELAQTIAHGKVIRHGRPWQAPESVWLQALQGVMARRDALTLPLKSHGYLFEIVTALANKAEAVEETAKHEALKHGTQRQGQARQLASIRLNLERNARKEFGQAPMTREEEIEFLRQEGYDL